MTTILRILFVVIAQCAAVGALFFGSIGSGSASFVLAVAAILAVFKAATLHD